MPPTIPEPLDEAARSQREPRYYVLRVHTIDRYGDPGLVSVIRGPYVYFHIAWCSAGELRRLYPGQIFVAGEMCLF